MWGPKIYIFKIALSLQKYQHLLHWTCLIRNDAHASRNTYMFVECKLLLKKYTHLVRKGILTSTRWMHLAYNDAPNPRNIHILVGTELLSQKYALLVIVFLSLGTRWVRPYWNAPPLKNYAHFAPAPEIRTFIT